MSDLAPAPIDYATGDRREGWLWRRRRWLFVAALLLVIAVVIHRSREPVRRYVLWQYWFWQLSRLDDADLPVATDDPMRGTTLQSARQVTIDDAGTQDPPARGDPEPIRQLRAIDWRVDEMCQGGIDGGLTSTLRLIRLRRPDGRPRTLVVYGPPRVWLTHWPSEMGFAVLGRPGVFEGPPTARGNGGRGFIGNGPSTHGSPRLAPVAGDPTAFTLEFFDAHGTPIDQVYVARGRRPTPFTGRLRDDDSIAFTDRAGVPLTGYDGKPLAIGRTFASVEARSQKLSAMRMRR